MQGHDHDPRPIQLSRRRGCGVMEKETRAISSPTQRTSEQCITNRNIATAPSEIYLDVFKIQLCATMCLCSSPPMKSNSSPRLAAEVPRSSVVSQSTVNNCNNCATIVSMIPTTTMAPLQSHSPVQGWVLSEAKSKASNICTTRISEISRSLPKNWI